MICSTMTPVSGREQPKQRFIRGNASVKSSSKLSVSKKRLAVIDRRQLKMRSYANNMSHVLKLPFSGLNCWIDRNTSRKTCCTASSASASLRKILFATLKRFAAYLSKRNVKASAFPSCISFASASSLRNLVCSCRRTDTAAEPEAGVSGTQVSGKSGILAGIAPNTSFVMRGLTPFSLDQPSSKVSGATPPSLSTATLMGVCTRRGLLSPCK